MRRPLDAVTAVAAFATLAVMTLAACGAPKSSGVRSINDSDVPPALFATTAAPTTLPPTTEPTPPPSAASTLAPVTSASEPTEPVTLYFIDGDQLAPFTIELPLGVTEDRVLELLEEGPPAGAGSGVRSAVPSNAILRVDVVEGVAVIELSTVVDDIDSNDQRLAIGQIVLSMKRPGVGQVRFTLAGEPKAVPLGDGSNSGRRELLFADYENLLDSTAVPTTAPPSTAASTVITPVTPPTTVP